MSQLCHCACFLVMCPDVLGGLDFARCPESFLALRLAVCPSILGGVPALIVSTETMKEES